MTGPFQETQVQLHRDALSTSWGFRLQGGKDFKTPLTVQRVFVGSPADGELHRGDVIESVQNYDATNMMHKQAQDLIKQAGGSLALRVRRSLQTRARSAPPAPAPLSQGRTRAAAFQPPPAAPSGGNMYGFVPKPQPQYGSGSGSHVGGVPREFGQNYGGGGQQPMRRGPMAPPNMLSKVNQSLNQALWQTNPDEYDPEYEPRSVNQLQNVFNAPPPRQQYGSSHGHTPRRKWTKPDPIPGTPKTLIEPGWTPKCLGGGRAYGSTPQYRQTQPSTPPAAFRQQQFPQQQQPQQQPGAYRPGPHQNASEDYKPSWKGSLKSSGGPKPWEMREQEQLAPGVAPDYQQQAHRPVAAASAPAPAPAADVPVHRPRVQNMHYGPGGEQEYQQHNPASHGDSDTARVAHLQYNTPIGLYSKSNVEQVMHSQTGGQPGAGTMQVTGPGSKPFNPAQSDVYRLLMEEEEMRKHPQRQQQQQQQQQPQQYQQSARYAEQAPGQEMHYQGFMDHSHQSPSMHALESNMSKFDDTMGTSDF